MPLILNGTTGVTFDDSSLQGAAASPFGLKNRIINGDMRIDQRNAGASVTPTALVTYLIDRWRADINVASKFSVQQNAGSVTPPAGFVNYAGITSLSSYTPSASEYFALLQPIEGLNTSDLAWGTASAQTVTLSFWVRSSLTGTFSGSIANGNFNRAYAFTYSISTANTWTKISITIPGDTTGTWTTNNGVGIYLIYSLGIGSNWGSSSPNTWSASGVYGATSTVNLVGTNGATFYITGVQLEQNTTATPFERRLYGMELALCYRYCWNLSSVGGNDNYSRFGVGGAEGTTSTEITIPFPVTMRANPSLTTTGTASNYAIYSAGAITAVSSISMIGAISVQTGLVNASVASGLTAGRETTLMANNNKTAYLLFTAEL